MVFGDKLKKLRKHKKITQKELAQMLFLKQSSISDYENNKSIPNGEIINKLTKIFNVSADYLLGTETDSRNTLEQTLEETIEELKQEETLMFMKDGDIDEESARLVKLAMKNAIRMVDEMNKNKNKE